MIEDLVKPLIDSTLWRYEESIKENEHYLYSKMKGFSDRRYTIKIQGLKRKVEGFRYKVFIYWTAYNPNNLVYKGRLNNHRELLKAIKSVNKDLLDVKRAY